MDAIARGEKAKAGLFLPTSLALYHFCPPNKSSHHQDLGLVDAFGDSLEKKPTLAVDGDQATWKADKLAKAAADKEVRPCTMLRL
jgi:hypothetical protein